MSVRIFLFVFLLLSELALGQNPDHEQWKVNRKEELISENGWLNLAGLFWIDRDQAYLNELSKDSLGISSEAGKKTIGTFQIQDDSVWFSFNRKVIKKSASQTPKTTLQYPVETYDQGGLYFGRWKWSVIKRGDRFAVRLRDLEHPALAQFEPIPTYEYDSNWRLEAFFEPKFNQTIAIPNVMGQVVEWTVMGLLKFEVHGEKQELIALEDEGKLFVIFSDETSGIETYPSGRYLHVAFPDQAGKTLIDFNYAYNPPCAFTAYATCPIPPKENRLNFRIESGEMLPKEH
jgi:uncharacterized protein